MEFKEGSIIVTKEGEFFLKRMMTLYNPFSLNPVCVFVVDDNGNDKKIYDKDVLSVKNNQIENIEEP